MARTDRIEPDAEVVARLGKASTIAETSDNPVSAHRHVRTYPGHDSARRIGDTEPTHEGWSWTITETSWDLTANLLPWELFRVGIYDDAVYGVLDDTAVLGY